MHKWSFLGVPALFGTFSWRRGISPDFPVPSQEQVGESRPRYLTNSQPRPPIIMIIIDSTHHHLSIIIIITGGRGCGLVRYCCTKFPPPREICMSRYWAQVETGSAAEARMRRGSAGGLHLSKVPRHVNLEGVGEIHGLIFFSWEKLSLNSGKKVVAQIFPGGSSCSTNFPRGGERN